MVARALRRARWRRPAEITHAHVVQLFSAPETDSRPQWEYASQCAGLGLAFLSGASLLAVLCALVWSL